MTPMEQEKAVAESVFTPGEVEHRALYDLLIGSVSRYAAKLNVPTELLLAAYIQIGLNNPQELNAAVDYITNLGYQMRLVMDH